MINISDCASSERVF